MMLYSASYICKVLHVYQNQSDYIHFVCFTCTIVYPNRPSSPKVSLIVLKNLHNANYSMVACVCDISLNVQEIMAYYKIKIR